MILIADLLLVIRCADVFSDKRWVAFLPGTPYLLSFASAIFGVATVHRDFTVPLNTQLPDGHEGVHLPMSTMGYITSVVSTTSSVAVNVTATFAIILRILASRRRTLKLKDQVTNDIEKLVSPSGRAEMGSPSYTKPPGAPVGGQERGKKDDHFVTVVAVLVESALPSAVLGVLACLVHLMAAWSAPGIEPLSGARFSIRILWLASTIMAPQAIMLRVLLRRDTHTRSRTADSEEGSLEFADAQALPRNDTLVSRRIDRGSRSMDSLSLSPSLASAKDEGDSVSRTTIPQEGRKDYDEERESGVQLEEGNVTKVERARLPT